MTSDTFNLAERLKEVRTSHDFTQSQLADKAGLSYFTVAKLEQGKIQDPSFFTILALCEALEVNIDEFTGYGQKHTQKRSQKLSKDVLGVYYDLHGVLVHNFDEVFGAIAHELHIEPGKLEDRFWRYDEALATGRMTLFDFEQALAFDLGVRQRQIRFREHYLEKCSLNQEMLDELFSYRSDGIKIGILTNAFPGFLDALFSRGTLPCSRSDFDMIVDSSEIGTAKPFPEIYEEAERVAGVSPRKLLLVDDTPSNVEAAKARNWQGRVYESATQA